MSIQFHAVGIAGLMFSHPIPVAIRETVERDGFVFMDVRPNGLPHLVEVPAASNVEI